jgi:hypothetical protein
MSIWKSIGHFFGNLFKKVQHVAEEVAPKAIELVNNIKGFDTANPLVGDLLTQLIPGTWDDNLKKKARLALPNILKDLGIANECAQISDINLFLKCVLDKINTLAPEIRGLYWHNIAILITNALADGQATIPEITGIIEAVYQEIENQKAGGSQEPEQP